MKYWVIVPAAGSSRRMAAATPKQYLPLRGRTVLEWALEPFLAWPECAGIVVVLAANDTFWPRLAIADTRVTAAIGGDERADSVLQGLRALSARAHADDWVLVHDAARPCLTSEDLRRLVGELHGDDVGGLLSAPLVDTLKRADADERVAETVPRAGLWRALTPQMFRYGVLERALNRAREQHVAVTDESSAVELLGLRPRLVGGRADNIKVTVPADLELASRMLAEEKMK
jgi:2-C-methyl-D-erythritol 4-phosphate cytidylyltransferase